MTCILKNIIFFKHLKILANFLKVRMNCYVMLLSNYLSCQVKYFSLLSAKLNIVEQKKVTNFTCGDGLKVVFSIDIITDFDLLTGTGV